MFRNLFLSITLLLPCELTAQVKQAYALFSANGKKVSHEKMIRTLSDADAVFFGELHDNPIAHWLQLEVVKDLYVVNNHLTLGMEMFEADDQIVLTEYLSGLIEEKHLLKEAKVWDNYKTDYRPLVEFAREKKLPVIATNIPRRYANLVYRKGPQALDSVSDEGKKWIAPLPLKVDHTQTGYQSMIKEMAGHGRGSAENLVASQASKDATMAAFIVKSFKKGNLFYHVNGAFHSQDQQGIITYLKSYLPELKILTIHCIEQENVDAFPAEAESKADFIICIQNDMTNTY